MKKKVWAGLLASASVLGVCIAGGTALAAEVDTHDTNVGIGFSGHTTPPGTDDLTLKWAPISFDFGSSNTVNAAAQAFNEDTGAKKYVVVSDARTTGSDEWKLTAELSQLTSGSSTLTGATLSFDSVKKGYVGTAAPETAGSIITPTAAHTATVAAASQTLTPGATAVVVMSDASVSYKGDTAMEMDNIKLNVPGGVAVEGKQYSGKLTWSLNDAI
ncbi:WxL domain-containing protein [Enterococcus sp. AZ163]|uniref:WxL domain-containing protein n=1 Tax=Enterococcus sp. AZ163 TaxID=2774638 RepID=UPI003D297797